MMDGLQIARAPEDGKRIHVQIISDVRFFRESLAETLARESDLVITGCFGALEEALSNFYNVQPDVILLDAAFPDGPEAVRRIRDYAPIARTVAIAVVETLENVITWGEAGIAGYIPRTYGIADIFPVLVDVMSGRQPCSASVAAGLLHRLAVPCSGLTGTDNMVGPPMLTSREMQIAQMIVEGMSNKDIARRLNIGVATAKTHVHHLLAKLKLRRRGQAANWMREHGYHFPKT